MQRNCVRIELSTLKKIIGMDFFFLFNKLNQNAEKIGFSFYSNNIHRIKTETELN